MTNSNHRPKVLSSSQQLSNIEALLQQLLLATDKQAFIRDFVLTAVSSACLTAQEEGATNSKKEAAHWKANHDNVVARLQLATQRPDLPVDRIPAIEALTRLQERSYVPTREVNWLSPEDLKALQRFDECANDFESGGHDVAKAEVTRLCDLGVLSSKGFGRHQVTVFGSYVLDLAADKEPMTLPLKSVEQGNADLQEALELRLSQVASLKAVAQKDTP